MATIVDFLVEFDGKEGGVTFVEMIFFDVGVTEFFEYFKSANTENDFLAKAIILVFAFIEMAGEMAVVFVVGGNIGIEKIDRNFEAGFTTDNIFPNLNRNFSVLNVDGGLSGGEFEVIIDTPVGGLGGLIAFGIDLLKKITVFIEHGDSD